MEGRKGREGRGVVWCRCREGAGSERADGGVGGWVQGWARDLNKYGKSPLEHELEFELKLGFIGREIRSR